MISAIVDGVLLLALVATTIRMVQMHRDLRRLGSYHEDYQRIFDQTALALDGIEVSVQEINVKGAQILNALGTRMDDARDLIAEIDALTREAKRQQAVLKAELKEISKTTAMMQKADRFSPTSDDVDAFIEDAPQARGQSNSLASSPQDGAVIHRAKSGPKAPTRVHKIENTLGSPFRSVSMNQKDNF